MPKSYSFNVIKHFRDPRTAVTLSGHTVHRSEFLVVPDAVTQLHLSSAKLKCVPYDNHFIYLDPEKKTGSWFAMCTCGSPAVIVSGGMLVCYLHALTGRHTNAS